MPELQAAPPLRADARRNRDALLRAARLVFAEQGLDAPLDAIAREAGVGRATLYRRFPTRDALISAISEDDFEVLVQVVRDAEDPDRAYFDFIDCALKMQVDNLGFIELFTRKLADPEVLQSIIGRFHTIVAPTLERAQQAGLVREDLRPEDTASLVLMLGAATAAMRDSHSGEIRRKRAIALVFDGLDPANAPRTLPALD
ncbi:MAG: helix-turn-helix domain-containing protein [Solirubrobacteraceae bacterium]|nr:helix-turn-helix domain-containing protein [Solirubrobacteraceae bacterium]